MPTRPPRACGRCRELVYGAGRCACAPKPYERFPDHVRAFYSSGDWTTASRRKRDSVATCEWPRCTRRPDVTDHRVSILERFDLRMVPENWQALCRSHHSEKQALERKGLYRDPVADELRTRKCPTHPNTDTCWRCQ